MEDTQDQVDRAERAFRFFLLLLVWGIWLTLRALWGFGCWVVSKEFRKLVVKLAALALLAAVILLGPHGVAFLWNRTLLLDAAEIAALQSEGKDTGELLQELRGRAFRLGFTAVAEQPEAFQVERGSEEAGAYCAITVDFVQPLEIYGWVTPPIRVRGHVKRWALPQRKLILPEGLVE